MTPVGGTWKEEKSMWDGARLRLACPHTENFSVTSHMFLIFLPPHGLFLLCFISGFTPLFYHQLLEFYRVHSWALLLICTPSLDVSTTVMLICYQLPVFLFLSKFSLHWTWTTLFLGLYLSYSPRLVPRLSDLLQFFSHIKSSNGLTPPVLVNPLFLIFTYLFVQNPWSSIKINLHCTHKYS